MVSCGSVYLTADGKAVRIKHPIADPTRIPARRKVVCVKKKVRYRKFRGRVPEVSSMWINPRSRIVPIEERKRQQDLLAQDIVVNTAYFADMQDALDRAEQESQCEQKEDYVHMVNVFQDVEELDD